jgi:hypothetical protein
MPIESPGLTQILILVFGDSHFQMQAPDASTKQNKNTLHQMFRL